MTKNNKKLFLLTTLVLIFVSISALSAADTNDTSTSESTVIEDIIISDNFGTDDVQEDVVKTDVNKNTNEVNNEESKVLKKSTTHYVSQENVEDIFSADGYKLSDDVSEGDTLDFSGTITCDHSIIIDKPVNVISSSYDAVLSFNSSGADYSGEDPGRGFVVTTGGAYSNITGLQLYNTQFWVHNTTHVTFDNMSMIVNGQRVGTGVGQTAIRASSYITIKNSYIYTKDNGGSSSVVLTICNHCLIDNCTIIGEGNVGNIFYINTFNVPSGIEGYLPQLMPKNHNNTINNCTILAPNAQAICIPVQGMGVETTFTNNIVNASGQSVNPGQKSVVVNNTFLGNVSFTASSNFVVANNTFNSSGTFTIAAKSNVTNNTVTNGVITGTPTVFENNTFTGVLNVTKPANITNNNLTYVNVASNGKNSNITDNYISGGINSTGTNVVIANNTIISEEEYAVIVTGSGSVVSDNYIESGAYIGDEAVSASSGVTVENNVEPPVLETLKMIVDATSVEKGEATTITINFDKSVSDGRVNVKINEDNVYSETIDTAKYSIVIEDIDTSNYNVGDNTVTVTYSNSNYFENTEKTATLTLTGSEPTTIATTTSIEDVNAIVGQSVTITANVACEEGVVESGNVVFTLADETILGESSVVNGTSSIEVVFNNTLSTILTATYTDTEGTYETSTSTSTTDNLVVNKATSKITLTPTTANAYVGDTVVITAVAKDENTNETITEGTITIDETSYPIEDGSVIYNYTVTTSDSVDINFTFDGNDNYEASQTETATITKDLKPLTIAVQATTVAINDPTTITILLNESVSDGSITVKINDETIVEETIPQETNTITITDIETNTFNLDDNTITIEYTGSQIYKDTTGEGTLTLTTRTLTITPTATTAPKADKTTITITLNETINDGTIVVKINNETINTQPITEKTNTITIENVETANYNLDDNTITIEYSGSQLYEDTTGEGTLTLERRSIELTADSISITKDVTSTNMTVNLNESVSDGTIKISVNDKVIGQTTISEETNNITIDVNTSNLTVGDNEVTLSYTGSELYNDATATSNINVVKSATTITVDSVTVSKTENTTVTATITGENTDVLVNGGKVVFKVNGITLKDANGKVIYAYVTGGVATLSYNFTDMNIESKTITAVYSGSSTYKASRSANATMEYESLNVLLTVESITATRGSSVTFTATVKDTNYNEVNDGKVIFKINGKTIKNSEGKVIYATVTNGIATANYELASNFKVKEFTLTAVYISNIYNRQTANATLTITE